MNMNITSIWEDFRKKTSFDSLEEVLAHVADNYNVSSDEAAELLKVSDIAMSEYFDQDKLNKKPGLFKKAPDKRVHDAISAIFINGVFFGMFLVDFLRGNSSKK